MSPNQDKPEAADNDPFAGFDTELLPAQKRPKLPRRTLLRRTLASLLFLAGILTVGSALYLGLLEIRQLFVNLTVFAGLGMCLLAFVLYDWHWPYKVKDILKRLPDLILEIFIPR
jgi:hypothetical protein